METRLCLRLYFHQCKWCRFSGLTAPLAFYSLEVTGVVLSTASGAPQPALVQALRRKRYRLPSVKPRSSHSVLSASVMFISWESTTSSVLIFTIVGAKKRNRNKHGGSVQKAQANVGFRCKKTHHSWLILYANGTQL